MDIRWTEVSNWEATALLMPLILRNPAVLMPAALLNPAMVMARLINPAVLSPLELTPQCLDPDQLVKLLTALITVFQDRMQAAAMTERELTARSGVSVESALGPFLMAADDFYSAGRAFAEFESDFFHRNPPGLIGYGGTPAPSLIFMCRDPGRIQSLLRMIDERLATLADEFRRSFSSYATDAQRLRFLTSPAPGQPTPGMVVGPGLRGATVAEQTALAMVRTYRQRLAEIAALMRAALSEVIPVQLRQSNPNLPISTLRSGL